MLRMALDAPWYVAYTTVHRDIQLPFVTDALHKTYSLYHLTLTDHLNLLLRHIPKHMPPARQTTPTYMYIVQPILHNYTVFIYTIKLTYDKKKISPYYKRYILGQYAGKPRKIISFVLSPIL